MTEREYQSPEDRILLENRILDAIPTGSEFDGCAAARTRRTPT